MAVTILPVDSVAYAASAWDDLHEDIFSSGYADKACVVKGRRGAGKNFQVSGVATPLAVEEGVCYVKGKRVLNSAAASVAVPAPVTNPRIDRIIVKFVFATNAVTIERLAGTEDPAPTAPALTQVDGNTWEVSLAQAHVTTGGVITVTNERRWAVPLGVFMVGEIKAIKATLGGTASKHPIDVDLGTADEDWALCDGGTYNGYVTDDLRNRMIIGAGTTYAAGTTYGAATFDNAHTHAVGTLGNAAESTHTHAAGTLAAASHTHAATGLSTGNAGPTTHTTTPVFFIAPAGDPTDTAAVAGVGNHAQHTHAMSGATAATTPAMSGSTAAGAAHTHVIAGATASSGSATQSVLSPCLARAYFMYAPAI